MYVLLTIIMHKVMTTAKINLHFHNTMLILYLLIYSLICVGIYKYAYHMIITIYNGIVGSMECYLCVMFVVHRYTCIILQHYLSEVLSITNVVK